MGFLKKLNKIKKGYAKVSKRVKKSKTFKLVKKGAKGVLKASDRSAKELTRKKKLLGGDLLK